MLPAAAKLLMGILSSIEALQVWVMRWGVAALTTLKGLRLVKTC
jgi:hypothetical protein